VSVSLSPDHMLPQAVSSLVSVGRQYFHHSFEDNVQFTVDAALAKDNHYTLFRYEDWPAWVTFTAVFFILITLDNVILNRNPQVLTVTRAVVYTLFWILMACAFCGWVYLYYGENQAYMWMSGYMLEWMLSFDNLFVFHLIFNVYSTPDSLKHRPLYLGIIGAVVFRLVFIFVGEYLMHAFFFMHFIFGSFLVYTGIKTATADDEDEDPSQHPLVQWLQRNVPFVTAYDSKGCFFVRCEIDEHGQTVLPEGEHVAREANERDSLAEAEAGEEKTILVADFEAHLAKKNDVVKTGRRATMLFLVVCCLELSDLLFAVDSVSAIVAQVPDLFLAYTSAVFAMLGLRATFFIIDVLVKLFSLLKYGVSIVLTFIGVKLIIGHMYHIPASIVCAVLVSALLGSMLASIIQDEMAKKAQGKHIEEVDGRVAKVLG
jgi:tellurite resistance protein TerC